MVLQWRPACTWHVESRIRSKLILTRLIIIWAFSVRSWGLNDRGWITRSTQLLPVREDKLRSTLCQHGQNVHARRQLTTGVIINRPSKNITVVISMVDKGSPSAQEFWKWKSAHGQQGIIGDTRMHDGARESRKIHYFWDFEISVTFIILRYLSPSFSRIPVPCSVRVHPDTHATHTCLYLAPLFFGALGAASVLFCAKKSCVELHVGVKPAMKLGSQQSCELTQVCLPGFWHVGMKHAVELLRQFGS